MEQTLRKYLDRCISRKGYKVGFYISNGEKFEEIRNLIKTTIKPDIQEDFTFSDLRSNKKLCMKNTKNDSQFNLYQIDYMDKDYKCNLAIIDAVVNESDVFPYMESYTMPNGKVIPAKYLTINI